MPTRTPTSSLSGKCHDTPLGTLANHLVPFAAVELLVKCVWYRCLAEIEKTPFRGISSDASAASRSPAARLPQEVVNTIVAYLTYDTHSLLACCHTSRSWYIAAMPHRRLTLYTHTRRCHGDSKHKWPKPLRAAHKLGLLPFVTELSICGLDIPSFMPDVRRCSRQQSDPSP